MTREEKISSDIKNSNIDTNLISDGYHTFGELYEHRIALYIRLVNETNKKYKRHKSKLHHDGSEFKGWFIVMGYINGKQISYHLPIEKWALVDCIEMPKSDERDGHTSEDVLNILKDQ